MILTKQEVTEKIESIDAVKIWTCINNIREMVEEFSSVKKLVIAIKIDRPAFTQYSYLKNKLPNATIFYYI